MADFFANYESLSVIRAAVNSLADLLKVAETDEAIAAGEVTSIPVATLAAHLLDSGDVVVLIDPATGAAHQLTLGADMATSDTALTVSAYTFTSDIPTGAKIYVLGVKLINIIHGLRHP